MAYDIQLLQSVGLAALLITYFVVTRLEDPTFPTKIGALAGALAWGFFANGATLVEWKDGALVYQQSYPGLTVAGIAGAIICLLFLVEGFRTDYDEIRQTGQTRPGD